MNKLISSLVISIFIVGSVHAGVPEVDAPNPESPSTIKSRYITFSPVNLGQDTALRVKLVSLYHPVIDPGNLPNFTAFEGEYRWVGPVGEYPDIQLGVTFMAAKLQCTPHYDDWAVYGELQVYGIEVVPDSIYEVQAVHIDCDPSFEICYSPILTVTTGKWGDVTADYAAPGSTVQPDFSDIAAVVDSFKNAPGALKKVIVHAAGEFADPARPLDFSDISATVDSFRGQPFHGHGPVTCAPSRPSDAQIFKNPLQLGTKLVTDFLAPID